MQHPETAPESKGSVVTIIAAIAVVITSFTVAGLVSYSLQARLSADRSWVIHTYEVLSAISSLKASVVEVSVMEDEDLTAQRLYKVKLKVREQLDQTGQLTRDNPQQVKNIGVLRPLIEHLLGIMDAHGSAVERQSALTAVESQLDVAARVERQLLITRTEKLEQSRTACVTSIIALFVIGAISLALALLVVVRLLSELAKAESESRQKAIDSETARVKLDAVLSSLSEGVYQLDEKGLLRYMNPAGEDILGYKTSEIIQKNMHDLVHYKLPDGTPRPRETCDLLKVMTEGVRFETREDYFVRKDQTCIPVQISSSPLIAQGKIIGAVVSFKDISERQAIEKRMSEFYSTVSHELRTPLTSIRAALGLMEGGAAGPLSERALKLVKVGSQESQRLVRLINDILDMKKLESGKFELHLQNVPVRELIMDTLTNLESSSAERKVRLSMSSDSGAATAYCDRDRIVQVLTNLVGNAVKFSPENSAVLVSSAQQDGEVEFCVRDSGPGITGEQAAKLFQMFHQIDSSDTRSKGGTGLGLAISKAIVEQHGGRIGVRSVVGEGATFWFTLPIASRLEPVSPSNEFIESNQEQHSAVSMARILLVEDDKTLSEIMSDTFVKDGYLVDQAHTLAAACEGLSKAPDVIVLDMMLPDGNGLDLIERVSSGVACSSAPMIVLTGGGGEIKRSAYPVIVDWLKKPFDSERMKRALSLALQRKTSGRPTVLIVDDDLTTREFIKHQLNGTEVNLVEAVDGAEAIHYARIHSPDLIILDIALPPPNGFEVIDILRREKASTTPLIIYSSRDLTKEDQRRLTLGITSYLEKSQTTDAEFMETVRTLLTASRPPGIKHD